MRLNESGIVHQQPSEEIIQLVRNGKHVYIDWKTNLQHVMKRQFLKTDRCDFSLSMYSFVYMM